MAATGITISKDRLDSSGSDNSVLIALPDMRIAFFGFVVAALIAIAGIVVYLLPISSSLKTAFLPLGVLFIVIIAYSAIMCEALANAVFTVTKDHVEERGGVIWKTQHRIPLSYVRDVSYNQSFLQGMFGVSSVSVSPTNGNKIVLSNIPNGETALETINKLVILRTRSL